MMRPRSAPAMRGLGAAALAMILVLSAPASAQESGTLEVGLFASTTAFDQGTTLSFGTSPGLGALIGYFPLAHLAVEAGWGQTWTSPALPPRTRVTWRPLRFQAVYHFPAGENFFPLAGLGYVRNSYGSAVTGSDSGLSGIVGFKTYVQDRLAFRADLHLDRVGTPFNDGATVSGSVVSSHTNWSGAAGLSYDLGRGRVQDGDGDGVADLADMCPDTPGGARVGADGCRPDGDLDGVLDVDDRCPLTPPRSRVDETGCRVDGDGDGVFDQDDECLDTLAGTEVDARGCAVPVDEEPVDTGVAGTDQVVAPPPPASEPVVESPPPAEEPEVEAPPAEEPIVDPPDSGEGEVVELVLEGVNFEIDGFELSAEARATLNAVAASLVANPGVRIRILGHTDSTGPDEWNQTLSQLRANSVEAHLAEQGVDRDRMETAGFGPDRPVAPNNTRDGRAQNRRADIERIGS